MLQIRPFVRTIRMEAVPDSLILLGLAPFPERHSSVVRNSPMEIVQSDSTWRGFQSRKGRTSMMHGWHAGDMRGRWGGRMGRNCAGDRVGEGGITTNAQETVLPICLVNYFNGFKSS